VGQQQKILIQWEEKENTLEQHQLLIAQNEKFNPPLQKIDVKKNEILLDLPTGKYFCKIVAKVPQIDISDVLIFSVDKQIIQKSDEKNLNINDLQGLKNFLKK
jgi:hypothetical protein